MMKGLQGAPRRPSVKPTRGRKAGHLNASADEVQRALDLLARLGVARRVADATGRSARTIIDWCRRHPDQWRQARENAEAWRAAELLLWFATRSRQPTVPCGTAEELPDSERYRTASAPAREHASWGLAEETDSVRPVRGARPRCGARTRQGRPCRAPAVWERGAVGPRNGRCRVHGGLSTGPRTKEGRERIAASNRRRSGRGPVRPDPSPER